MELECFYCGRPGRGNCAARLWSLDFGLATDHNKSCVFDRIIDVLGENSVHNVELYSNHRIDSSIEDSEDEILIHNLQSL